jgi:hypothetical protein
VAKPGVAEASEGTGAEEVEVVAAGGSGRGAELATRARGGGRIFFRVGVQTDGRLHRSIAILYGLAAMKPLKNL